MAVLGKVEPQIYAILRIMAGLMFIFHGTQKLIIWPGGKSAAAFLSRSWFAGVIEMVGGSLIVIGLFAGIVAFIASGEMAFAYFLVHAKDGFFPILNRGELAVLYCFVFLYISARGAGIWSVDALISRGKRVPVASAL
jgi:putative oxidoreductase